MYSNEYSPGGKLLDMFGLFDCKFVFNDVEVDFKAKQKACQFYELMVLSFDKQTLEEANMDSFIIKCG